VRYPSLPKHDLGDVRWQAVVRYADDTAGKGWMRCQLVTTLFCVLAKHRIDVMISRLVQRNQSDTPGSGGDPRGACDRQHQLTTAGMVRVTNLTPGSGVPTLPAGGELPQLLNVIFGNTSIKENVMVMDLQLSPTLLGKFLGPRFGTQGLRDIVGVPKVGLYKLNPVDPQLESAWLSL
jgi:hypothetical protein